MTFALSGCVSIECHWFFWVQLMSAFAFLAPKLVLSGVCFAHLYSGTHRGVCHMLWGYERRRHMVLLRVHLLWSRRSRMQKVYPTAHPWLCYQ
jgi:hypothetical protein